MYLSGRRSLEPVVEQNMDRHLNTEDLWFAHDYVPFERGENFAFLGGRDWDDGLLPGPQAPLEPMDAFRNQLLRTFSTARSRGPNPGR